MRHGFLLIDKPEGPTSHDIVAMVRKGLSEKKVGHLGTLDPLASGLMVLAVGAKALKVVELFVGLSKAYEAGVTFGVESATYDREGPLEEYAIKPGVPEPDELAVRTAIEEKFVGRIDQVPPAASAVHVGGERAYRKMRQGKPVDLPSREVEISACKILSYSYPELTLQVECSSGTYIRSLAHDLGMALRVGGYLSSLKRTKVGEFSFDDACGIDDVTWGRVLPLKDVLVDFPKIEISESAVDDITHGRTIDQPVENGTFAWFDGKPIAILEKASKGGMKARKVL